MRLLPLLYPEVVIADLLSSLPFAQSLQRELVIPGRQGARRQVHRDAVAIAGSAAWQVTQREDVLTRPGPQIGAEAGELVSRLEQDLDVRELDAAIDYHLIHTRFGPGWTGQKHQ